MELLFTPCPNRGRVGSLLRTRQPVGVNAEGFRAQSAAHLPGLESPYAAARNKKKIYRGWKVWGRASWWLMSVQWVQTSDCCWVKTCRCVNQQWANKRRNEVVNSRPQGHAHASSHERMRVTGPSGNFWSSWPESRLQTLKEKGQLWRLRTHLTAAVDFVQSILLLGELSYLPWSDVFFVCFVFFLLLVSFLVWNPPVLWNNIPHIPRCFQILWISVIKM